MSEQAQGPDRVGVRELRQNLSVYLDRVKQGETLEVTEHAHPVALLTPLPRATMSTLDRLVAEGRVTPGSGDLPAYLRADPPARSAPVVGPPAGTRETGGTTAVAPEREPTMAEILHRMRDEAER